MLLFLKLQSFAVHLDASLRVVVSVPDGGSILSTFKLEANSWNYIAAVWQATGLMVPCLPACLPA